MKLGLILPYEGSLSFADALQLTQRAEARGFDSVWMPEAYGTDAISILGALAARTERIRLGTGIVNVFSRTPALLAQTAATLDLISGGRFILGLGTSGHQVVSGWHGMAFYQPLLRMREPIAIVRHVPVSIDDDRARAREALKPWVALYVGGMGSRTKNFYNDLVSRYGFAEDARTLQDLYLGGKQLEAIRRVPDALVDAISIAG